MSSWFHYPIRRVLEALALALCVTAAAWGSWRVLAAPGGATARRTAARSPMAVRAAQTMPQGAVARLGDWILRHGHDVKLMAFSRDARYLVSCDIAHHVFAWDLETGNCFAELPAVEDEVTALGIAGDGRYLALALRRGTIEVWCTAPVEPWCQLDGHKESHLSAVARRIGRTIGLGSGERHYWAHDLVFLDDNVTLVSAGGEGELRYWNINRGSIETSHVAHAGPVLSVELSPDGKFLATSGWDGRVRLWDTTTHQRQGQSFRAPGPVSKVIFGAEGKSVRFLAMQPLTPFALYELSVPAMELAREAQSPLALGSQGSITQAIPLAGNDEMLLVENRNRGQLVRFTGSQVARASLDFQPRDGQAPVAIAVAQGDRLAVARGSEIELVSLAAREIRRFPRRHRGEIVSVSASMHEPRVATADQDGVVRLWRLPEATLTREFNSPERVQGITWLADRQTLATSHASNVPGALGSLRFWNTETGEPVTEVAGQSGQIDWRHVSWDGGTLVSTQPGNESEAGVLARVVDVVESRVLAECDVRFTRLESFQLSYDRRIALFAGRSDDEGPLLLDAFDMSTGKSHFGEPLSFRSHLRNSNFSNDSKAVALAIDSGSPGDLQQLILLDLKTGKPRWRHRLPAETSARFLQFWSEPDRLAAFALDAPPPGSPPRTERVLVFDLATGKREFALGEAPAPLAAFATQYLGPKKQLVGFTPDGHLTLINAENASQLHLGKNAVGRLGPVTFDPEYPWFWAADEGRLLAFDLASAEHVATRSGHHGPIRLLSSLPAGQGLLSTGADGVCFLWRHSTAPSSSEK